MAINEDVSVKQKVIGKNFFEPEMVISFYLFCYLSIFMYARFLDHAKRQIEQMVARMVFPISKLKGVD